ncbi:MAG: hypothetical protein H6653_11605 [Ardenticatenaceae bacterium]|nr:hypothetical protein [Ardenticatenaceae bacterium]
MPREYADPQVTFSAFAGLLCRVVNRFTLVAYGRMQPTPSQNATLL